MQCNKCNGYGFLVLSQVQVDDKDRPLSWTVIDGNEYEAPPERELFADYSDLDPIPCKTCRGWGCVNQANPPIQEESK